MNNSKLKVALCISGHFRSMTDNIRSIKEHILSNPQINCDIFIHTWNIIDRNHRLLNVNKLLEEYNPKKYIIEAPIQFPITKLMEDMNLNKRDINGLLSMFYKIEKCNLLKKEEEELNNFKYDCVIRFRADVLLHNQLEINNIDLSKIHIPMHGDYGGINDQFAFSNSSNMDLYSSTFSNIEKYLEAGVILNPEFFTKETIFKHNLELVRPYIKYLIKWVNGQCWDNETRFLPK